MALTHASALHLDAANYPRHTLHSEERAWVEKNCYIDVWIEVLHSLGLDPFAALSFTLTLDFEGDQWTFFKPPHADLLALYGIEVHELNVWRPILEHAVHHLHEGKLIFTEADAFFLPDTRGTDYRQQHTKTTIVIETIDAQARRLGYFHNAGYFSLAGEDFANLFRVEVPPDPTFLPLFAEYVRIDRSEKLPPPALAARSEDLLRAHLARRPARNPFTRYKARFVEDLEWLKGQPLSTYHAYAFATVRQIGANFELAAAYLKWLDAAGRGGGAGERAAADFEAISTTAKALILKGARAVTRQKPADFGPMLEAMQESWQTGIERLLARFGSADGPNA